MLPIEQRITMHERDVHTFILHLYTSTLLIMIETSSLKLYILELLITFLALLY